MPARWGSVQPSENGEADALVQGLPKELGVLLVVSGIGGLILPGPIGTPFLLLGGLILWPSGFGRVESCFEMQVSPPSSRGHDANRSLRQRPRTTLSLALRAAHQLDRGFGLAPSHWCTAPVATDGRFELQIPLAKERNADATSISLKTTDCIARCPNVIITKSGSGSRCDARGHQEGLSRAGAKYHPDVNPGDKSAEGSFKEVQSAYDILSDQEKRGFTTAMAGRAFEGMAASGPRANSTEWASRFGEPGFENIDLSDLLGSFAARVAVKTPETPSIFEDLMGRVRGGRPGRQRGGRTLEAHLTIPFLTAVKGGETTIEVQRPPASRKASSSRFRQESIQVPSYGLKARGSPVPRDRPPAI